jgi:gamma-glutamylcyclotransferase (GGCT)/AIG2-like uncharacterized protein YtfP
MQAIFIYGTLKRGHIRHRALKGQKFISNATTAPRYWMCDLGRYPGLVHASPLPGSAVQGEVYWVDDGCRTLLDRVEGVDHGLYELQPIQLARPNELGTVSAYFYLGKIDHCDRLVQWTKANESLEPGEEDVL